MDKRIIVKKNGKKEYYISTSMGYTPITNNVIDRGLIVIDENKVWNPKPIKLSDSDYVFIKENLPDWFKKKTKLSDNIIAEIDSISIDKLKQKIKYVFTDFFYSEEDVYLLKLENQDIQYRIYLRIETVGIVDHDSNGVIYGKNKLAYPFENEDWNKNFYETKEEYLKMRDKEEDGYEKYFSNK